MNKEELREKILELDGISNEEKLELVRLLDSQKQYGLVWEDKPEDIETLLKEQQPVLTEVKERALTDGGEDAPNHVLIEGDNLAALTALSYTHEGKVDVIYIDPPYNTGNKDFVYNDSFVDVEDGYRHSKWLSFMHKRLLIAKRLMSDKGVIFISIDDNEQANLKLLCDEVFGENNNEATISYVRKTSGKQDSSNFVKSTEYILIYSKMKQWTAASLIAKEKVTDRYNKVDASGRAYRETDLRKTGNSDRRIDRPFMYYPFYYHPQTKDFQVYQEHNVDLIRSGYIEIYPIKPDNTDGRWRWSYQTSLTNIENLVAKEMPKYKGKYTVYEKDYIDKKEDVRTVKEHTAWDRKEFNSDNAMADFKKLGFGNQDFPYPKSTDLIKHIIFLSNYSDSTVLDFFAGSGTTLQAIMQLNAEEGSHRQCILVTNNENNICENVTYERNKRVIQGYITPQGVAVEGLKNNNLRYYKTDFMSREMSFNAKQALMRASVDMVCIKENIYKEESELCGYSFKPTLLRYFKEADGRQMLFVFDERVIEHIIPMIAKLDGKVKVYVFSNGAYAYEDDFEEIRDKVELCALPEAILQVYHKVLPHREEEVRI